jgi:hypothetical protein
VKNLVREHAASSLEKVIYFWGLIALNLHGHSSQPEERGILTYSRNAKATVGCAQVRTTV